MSLFLVKVDSYLKVGAYLDYHWDPNDKARLLPQKWFEHI